MIPRHVLLVLAVLATPGILRAQFYSNDTYTEYSMLEPGSGKFRIVYYVTERTPGSKYLVNPVRPGSVESDVVVIDPMDGKPLKFDDMTGAEMIAAKMPGRYDPKEKYLRVHLPRPVPQNGEVRVRIDKTYYDPKAYIVEGNEVLFKRTRGGISSNSMVLPKGYSLVSSNVAAQIFPTPDGRLKISFANVNDYTADVVIRGRKTPTDNTSHLNFEERSFFNVETLYDLQNPATHKIRVVHDYTEHQSGHRSRIQLLSEEPLEELSVLSLDSGTTLKTEKQGMSAYAHLETPLMDGQTARLRVHGVVTDPGYRTEEQEMVWDRTFSTLRNTVLLPLGWELVSMPTPGVVSTDKDGRVSLHWVNPRTDPMRVTFRAKRRP